MQSDLGKVESNKEMEWLQGVHEKLIAFNVCVILTAHFQIPRREWKI